MPRIQC